MVALPRLLPIGRGGLGAGKWGMRIARFVQNRPAVAGTIVLTFVILMAVFADPLGGVSPLAVDTANSRSAPSEMHILGTDLVGRDVWSRLVHASRVSLAVGFGAVGVATALGMILGALAGFYRGWIDAIVARLSDIVLAFPVIILLMVAGSILGSGLWQLILLLGAINSPGMIRLVRGEVLSLRERDFVLASRSIGAGSRRLIVRHVLPGSIGVIVVNGTFSVAHVIMIAASLSFLGLGVQPPTPSWGNMLKDAQSLTVLHTMPWLWLPPAVLVLMTIMAVNFIGDGLRDALDPRAQVGLGNEAAS